MRTINMLELPLEDDEDNDALPRKFDLAEFRAEDSKLFRLTLNALRKCEYLTDIYIFSKHSVFLAHKLMLHIASNQFHNFKRTADGYDMLGLKKLDSKCVNMILDFIYTGEMSLKSICITNIKALIRINDKLNLQCFRVALLSSIVSHLAIANFERFWELAEETRFPQLTEAVISFLQRQFDYLGTTTQFLSLPLEKIRQLHGRSLSHPGLHSALKPYLHKHHLHYADLLEDSERMETPLPDWDRHGKVIRNLVPNLNKHNLQKNKDKPTLKIRTQHQHHKQRDQPVDNHSGDRSNTTYISIPMNDADQSYFASSSRRKRWSSSPTWTSQPKVLKPIVQTTLPKKIPTLFTEKLLLVVVGGPRHENIHLMYSQLNHLTWLDPEEMNLPVQKSSSFVHGKHCLYMIGGGNFERNESSCYCWDTTLRQRTQLCHLIVRHANPQIAVIGDVIYVVGGSGWFSPRLSQTEYLIRTEGIWHLAAAMKQARDETASMVASSTKGKLYIVGGGTNKCEEFCVKKKKWSELPSLPEDLSLFHSKVMLGLAYDTLIAFYDYRPSKVFLLVPHKDTHWKKFSTKEPLPGLVQCCTSWNNKVLVLCKKGAIYNYNLPKNMWCFLKQVPKPWTEMLYIGVVNPDR